MICTYEVEDFNFEFINHNDQKKKGQTNKQWSTKHYNLSKTISTKNRWWFVCSWNVSSSYSTNPIKITYILPIICSKFYGNNLWIFLQNNYLLIFSTFKYLQEEFEDIKGVIRILYTNVFSFPMLFFLDRNHFSCRNRNNSYRKCIKEYNYRIKSGMCEGYLVRSHWPNICPMIL